MSRIFLSESQFRDFRKVTVLILGIVLISSLIPLESAYAATVNFSFPTSHLDGNLGTPGGVNSQNQQLVADGDSVYVVWREADDIMFSRSIDNGTNFDTNASDIGDVVSFSGLDKGFPQIASSSNRVFVVWDDGDSLRFNTSVDGGSNFASSGTIDTKNGCPCNPFLDSVNPQIVSSNGSAYVAWSENAEILFSSNTQGNAYSTPLTIHDSSPSTSSPQIAATDLNVYVVWSNSTSVLLSSSTNVPNSFPDTVVLGAGNTNSAPEITAEGNNIHVIWKVGTDLNYVRSINQGLAFSDPSDIGDTDSTEYKIAATGDKVYVVWSDSTLASGEILFRASTDSGSSLESPVGSPDNLSNSPLNSISPQISASGTNVFVAWEDKSAAFDTFGDIVYVQSGDSGSDFSSAVPQNISTTPLKTSKAPTIDSSGNNVYVAWQDTVISDPFGDVLFQTGVIFGPTISFNLIEYTVKDPATITVVEETSSGDPSKSVTVTSSSDPTGITIVLLETLTSGTYDGSLTFTNTGASDDATDVLEADTGDSLDATITVGPDTFGGTSKITPSSMSIPDASGDYESIIDIEVIDENANLDNSTAETITVTLTSNIESVNIQLVETGLDTGVFGGAEAIIMTGDHRAPLGDIELVQDYTDTCALPFPPDSVCNSAVENTIDIRVTSTSDSTGIVKTLVETGPDTKLFSGTLTISDSTVNGTSIEAVGGDFVTLDTIGFIASNQNLLVTPTTPSRNAIQMEFPIFLLPDILQITYKDSLKTFTPSDGGAGGGGGGLIRPGLVVNVLAGAVGGGGGGGPPGPTITLGALALYDSASETISLPQEIRAIAINYDPYTLLEPTADIYEDFDFPLSINGNGFVLGGYENTLVPQTVRPGEPVEFVLVFYTTSEVAFTSLNFNLGPTRTIAGSDTQVLLYKDKPAEIIDPNGNIATATGSINNDGELKRVATFSITFSEFIQWAKSDMVIRSWNENLNSGDTIIYDAIQVLPSEEITFVESVTETLTSEELASIPIWIKNNADWWATGQIDDSDFIAGIQYLVEQDIIKVPQTESTSPVTATEIPDWVRDVAGFWADDLINNVEFVQTIQWLVTNGIVMV